MEKGRFHAKGLSYISLWCNLNKLLGKKCPTASFLSLHSNVNSRIGQSGIKLIF